MLFFLCLFYMFHRCYSNCRPLNSARFNCIICQTIETRHFLRGCGAYCTRWRKVTKVTNPISDFTFLSTAKSGKSRIKNPFFDSPKGTHPRGECLIQVSLTVIRATVSGMLQWLPNRGWLLKKGLTVNIFLLVLLFLIRLTCKKIVVNASTENVPLLPFVTTFFK